MFIIIIMLVVGLVPTGYFDWNYPGSYAICSYGQPPPGPGNSMLPNSYLTMILSSLLLTLGFLTRVVRLYKSLSIDFILWLRSWLSELVRRGLRGVYAWCRPHRDTKSIRRSLIYHPILACFFMLRVSLDIYSSMFMEVRSTSISSLFATRLFISSIEVLIKVNDELLGMVAARGIHLGHDTFGAYA